MKGRKTGGKQFGGLRVMIEMRYYDRNLKETRRVRGGSIVIVGMTPEEIRAMITRAAEQEAERRRALIQGDSK